VATICRYLLDKEGYDSGDILILMRSDRNASFSSVLREALEAQNVPVAIRAEGTPMDTREGRIYLSILHLLADDNDSLALRTLLTLRDNRIGTESYSAIYNLALNSGDTFSTTAHKVMVDHGLIPHLGERIAGELRGIRSIIDAYRERFETLSDSSTSEGLLHALRDLAENVIHDTGSRTEVLGFFGINCRGNELD
jgi:superfamily I DNA/RNA helicase